jgi:type II secretory pathway predicted ATPase ExeA
MNPMIEAFYNFKRLPFRKDIAGEEIFLSAAGKEMLQRLEYMKQNRGLMLVTGLPGTGKTLHLRAFSEQINANLYQCFYLPLSTVSTSEFYRQLAVALNAEDYWKKSQLFQSIQRAIKQFVSNKKKIPIIIFDEAHLLKNENFYELQIISNFNMDSIDPALFILVGQPHLCDRLLSPIHQAFNQRINLKFCLTPLGREETEQYINHHLKLAGRSSHSNEALFSPSAIDAIHRNSSGTPRVINTLAIKSLTLGALEKKEMLTEEDVYAATKEL